MNVGELKKALEDVPDGVLVVLWEWDEEDIVSRMNTVLDPYYKGVKGDKYFMLSVQDPPHINRVYPSPRKSPELEEKNE